MANFVVVGVGTGGKVSVTPGPTLPNAQTHVIVDVVGYYATSAVTDPRLPAAPAHPGPRPRHPQRDRRGHGPAGEQRAVRHQAPRRGRRARRRLRHRCHPEPHRHRGRPHDLCAGDAARARSPTTSSLNLLPGQNKANLAMVPLSADGRGPLLQPVRADAAVADVVGYYQKVGNDDESRAGRVVPLAAPFRAIETRRPVGATA